MEKDQFIHVVHHFAGSSVQEAQEVLSLKERYPYSQLLHALSARVSKDHGFSTHNGELQLAAIYAADRGVLKEIMLEEMEAEISPVVIKNETASKLTISTAATSYSESSSSDNEGLAEEVLHDLERLHELRHNFERLFDKPQTPVANAEVEVVTETSVSDTDVTSSDQEPKLSGKSKKERIVEMAKALERKALEEKGIEENTEENARQKPKKKRKHDGEELIDEIVSSKEQLEPESEKQKEQIQLIEHFIRIQPSITNIKEKLLAALPAGDLSTTKTGEFGDNIVSETLVEILIKQGKKDRAIEVLKKLIWKYPQKKAYFAAQIEDLKK